jgi:hypothetical protein
MKTIDYSTAQEICPGAEITAGTIATQHNLSDGTVSGPKPTEGQFRLTLSRRDQRVGLHAHWTPSPRNQWEVNVNWFDYETGPWYDSPVGGPKTAILPAMHDYVTPQEPLPAAERAQFGDLVDLTNYVIGQIFADGEVTTAWLVEQCLTDRITQLRGELRKIIGER